MLLGGVGVWYAFVSLENVQRGCLPSGTLYRDLYFLQKSGGKTVSNSRLCSPDEMREGPGQHREWSLASKHRRTAANAFPSWRLPELLTYCAYFHPHPILRKSCRLLVRGLERRSAPQEKCEIPFLREKCITRKQPSSGFWPLCAGQSWNLVQISCGKPRGL